MYFLCCSINSCVNTKEDLFITASIPPQEMTADEVCEVVHEACRQEFIKDNFAQCCPRVTEGRGNEATWYAIIGPNSAAVPYCGRR